jgi:hypothetical protein
MKDFRCLSANGDGGIAYKVKRAIQMQSPLADHQQKSLMHNR